VKGRGQNTSTGTRGGSERGEKEERRRKKFQRGETIDS